MNVLGVIPARYQSVRFPGKPLAPLHGKPMVQWVYEAARRALPKVIVATDDKRIVSAVENFGGRAVLTPRSCKSGTDRMYFVSKKIPAAYYVNVQGDEPLMSPVTIKEALRFLLKKKGKGIGTAATTLRPKEKTDPAAVKVVVGHDGQALYFSRSLIPFAAHGAPASVKWLKHLGIYVYPKNILKQFVKWPSPELERTEQLEQLRALYFGCPIYVAFTRHDSIGVDRPSDLLKVARILRR